MADQERKPLMKAGALWMNKKDDGSVFFSGFFGGLRMIVFKNGFKQEANHPDYIVYLTENTPREKEGEEEGAKPKAKVDMRGNRSAPTKKNTRQADPKADDDEIPF